MLAFAHFCYTHIIHIFVLSNAVYNNAPICSDICADHMLIHCVFLLQKVQKKEGLSHMAVSTQHLTDFYRYSLVYTVASPGAKTPLNSGTKASACTLSLHTGYDTSCCPTLFVPTGYSGTHFLLFRPHLSDISVQMPSPAPSQNSNPSDVRTR